MFTEFRLVYTFDQSGGGAHIITFMILPLLLPHICMCTGSLHEYGSHFILNQSVPTILILHHVNCDTQPRDIVLQLCECVCVLYMCFIRHAAHS